jgi:hypothetical protein
MSQACQAMAQMFLPRQEGCNKKEIARFLDACFIKEDQDI